MPNADRPEALQLPGMMMERLTAAVGQTVVVYVKHVHAPPIVGAPGVCPPYVPTPPGPGGPTPGAGGGSAWGGPPLTPGVPPGGGHVGPIPMAWECDPCRRPMMGTAVVSGTLGFAGVDYLVIRIPVDSTCADILIPYSAVGMIVLPCM